MHFFVDLRIYLFVFQYLLFSVFANQVLASDNLTFDLRGAVSYALKQVPELDSVRKQKEISELTLRTAYFSFFPKLQLSALSNLSTTHPLWPAMWNNGLSLVLQQPILSHSINGLGYEVASTKDAIAKLNLQNQRDLLCMKVAKDLIAYSSAVQQWEIKKHKLNALLKELDVVTRRFQQGLKIQKDVLRFQAQVQQAQIQAATAKNRLDQSKDVLITAITGVNRQQVAESFEFVPLKPPQVALEVIPKNEPKIENHVLYKKLELEQKIAVLDVDLSKRQLWPELSATASAQGNANHGLSNSTAFAPSATFMIGLSLQYELFDFGKKGRDISIAMKNKEIKANAIQTKLSNETATIAQMMTSFTLLRESIALNKKLLRLEEENFKRIQNDYLQGKAQYLDVISALNNLSDVKSALYSSVFDLEEKMITYRYYEGTLYDWIF